MLVDMTKVHFHVFIGNNTHGLYVFYGFKPKAKTYGHEIVVLLYLTASFLQRLHFTEAPASSKYAQTGECFVLVTFADMMRNRERRN